MDFNLTSLFIGMGFGVIGFSAWRYGRKMQSGRHMLLAVGLMGYAYFVPNPWISLAVGSVLTVLLFWP